ncbi:MAG: phosphoribosylanthranilate isomerase [Gammaproteobacteria bacterium]|nr:phosphoribosylanthranilate isomerase [Gammaproteobacteria bacterium]
MSLWVKICGLRDAADVACAVEAGADAVGFVFARSVREVTPAQALRACQDLPEGVLRIAVMRHPEPAAWQQVWREFRPDWLQTDWRDYAALVLAPELQRLPVYRDDSTTEESIGQLPAQLLFEGSDSGTGRTADWARAAQLARRCRLVLAGGLDADNVAEAVRKVQPFGVDVSSGVEASPGVKDPARIRAFIAAARAAELNT